VRAAGYALPAFWGTGRKDNFIESIGAGYASAGDVWRMWMNSTGHRTHLLGRKSMYKEQTNYGIGYYADPASPYRCYWVIITAPPEQRTVVDPSARLVTRDPGTRATFWPGNGVTLLARHDDRGPATRETASVGRLAAATKTQAARIIGAEPAMGAKSAGNRGDYLRGRQVASAPRPTAAGS
jgi:hypothetical protein